MASRYNGTEISVNKDTNKKYYKTTIYSEIEESDSDMYFISQAGDRLDNLAARFYGDIDLWTLIARANNLKTMNVPPGISLRIPSIN
tara:strand:- start:49 stop:309 length:261 start_codon:yes stop_codon:yes gene_type:complete